MRNLKFNERMLAIKKRIGKEKLETILKMIYMPDISNRELTLYMNNIRMDWCYCNIEKDKMYITFTMSEGTYINTKITFKLDFKLSEHYDTYRMGLESTLSNLLDNSIEILTLEVSDTIWL